MNKIRIIEAELVSGICPTHDSAEASILHARELLSQRPRDIESIRDATITRATYADERVTFVIGGHGAVITCAEGDHITSRFVKRVPADQASPDEDCEVVMVRTPRAQFRWDRGRVLSKTLGRRIRAWTTVGSMHFVYFDPHYIILFLMMINISSGRRFLHCDETD